MPDIELGSLTPIDWDETVELCVTVRVRAQSNPELYQGDYHRTPLNAASTAILAGCSRLENIDGFADIIGEAQILRIEEW